METVTPASLALSELPFASLSCNDAPLVHDVRANPKSPNATIHVSPKKSECVKPLPLSSSSENNVTLPLVINLTIIAAAAHRLANCTGFSFSHFCTCGKNAEIRKTKLSQNVFDKRIDLFMTATIITPHRPCYALTPMLTNPIPHYLSVGAFFN